MNHIRYDQWLLYAQNRMDEEERENYETHLYSCDHCLELYIQAVEASQNQLPELSQSSGFTDSVMDQIIVPISKQQKKVHIKKNRKQQTVVHYFLAAAMTLILMSTGVFSQLMNIASEFEQDEVQQNESFVFSFLNKQSSITDKFEENFKEGNPNE